MRLTLVFLLGLAGGCSDPREELLQLPHEVATLLRDGEIGEALGCLDPDFEGDGLDRSALEKVLLYRNRFDPVAPRIAEVILDPAQDGADERDLIVLGLLPKGDPLKARPRNLGPFRLTARARIVDGEWKIVTASLER